ncbi:hypothetical protein [Rhizobium sp.]|uniref:hypothetical protein n=1 Tax=Rhizobium sp. TaxID=391 RepID=UPI0028AD52FE
MTTVQAAELTPGQQSANIIHMRPLLEGAIDGHTPREAPFLSRALVPKAYRPFIELSLRDLIHDPLVAAVNRADGISADAYAQLLQSAARVDQRRRASKLSTGLS